MHKQNDVVIYVEAGVETPALVVSGTIAPDLHGGHTSDTDKVDQVEHLTLVFLPATTQGVQNLTPIAHGCFLRTVFGVRPLNEAKTNGWKEYCEDLPAEEAEFGNSIKEIVNAAKLQFMKPPENPPAELPSAEDLDAAASEEKAKQQTGTEGKGEQTFERDSAKEYIKAGLARYDTPAGNVQDGWNMNPFSFSGEPRPERATGEADPTSVSEQATAQQQLATSDPEAHQQAISDAAAEAKAEMVEASEVNEAVQPEQTTPEAPAEPTEAAQ